MFSRLPLCIEYSSYSALHVVLSDQRGVQVEGYSIRLTMHKTPHTTAEQHVKVDQVDSQDHSTSEMALHLSYLLRSFMILHNALKENVHNDRSWFCQLVGNVRYYSSQTLEELERLEILGVMVEVKGVPKGQLFTQLHGLEKEILLAEYRHSCEMLLDDFNILWQSPGPRLFLTLPADLNSWDDLDPTTHSFRVYFMCDYKMHVDALRDLPRHLHLSDHLGYTLKRPQEFFHIYGDYVLRILQMVYHGYSFELHGVPPLHSFEILWDDDIVAAERRLPGDIIESLVAKTITYIQELSPPKWTIELALTPNQSAEIKTYLEILDGDDAKGNLHRRINPVQRVHWMCQAHALQCIPLEILEELIEFVQGRGGWLDMQEAALKVELSSEEDVDQFCTLLVGTRHTFDISVKLNWKSTRLCVMKLCLKVVETNAVILEIDGITLDIHPQDFAQYTQDLIDEVISPKSCLRFIALLNYPRPQEQRLYTGNCSVQLPSSPVRPAFDWVKLTNVALEFAYTYTDIRTNPTVDRSLAPMKLKAALEDIGLQEATEFNFSIDKLRSVLDLEDLSFVEVYSHDMAGYNSVTSSGTLQRLTIHLENPQLDVYILDCVEANTLLQELNISYYGQDVLYYTWHTVWSWHRSSTSSRLTLVDRMADTQGRIVAQLAKRSDCQQEPLQTESIEFLQWDCDHIFSQLDYFSCWFLSRATEQHPSVLTLLTLDTSKLSREGLYLVEDILYQSNLEHLHVVCSHFDLSMSDSVSLVLHSVQWSTLKSLKLSGDDIDAWICVWMSPCSNPFNWNTNVNYPRLLQLHLRGDESAPQVLSHTSSLFVHGLVYLSPSVKVHLTNVVLKEDFC